MHLTQELVADVLYKMNDLNNVVKRPKAMRLGIETRFKTNEIRRSDIKRAPDWRNGKKLEAPLSLGTIVKRETSLQKPL